MFKQRQGLKRNVLLSVPAKKQTEEKKLMKPKHQIIIQQCLKQNKKFALWYSRRQWNLFHSSHYDWWAFPIDQNSGSYGSAYKVQNDYMGIMAANQQFITALKTNAIMVCHSWGWDLEQGEFIQQKHRNQQQKWQRWPIRLSKMCRSLQIFGRIKKDVWHLFINAIIYAILLLESEKKFTYGGKNLTPYFLQKHQQIKKQIDRQKDRIQKRIQPQKLKKKEIEFQTNEVKSKENWEDRSSL